MSAALQRAQKQLATDMGHLATTLRQIARARTQFSAVDVMTLDYAVRDLQEQIYRLAERLDLLEPPS